MKIPLSKLLKRQSYVGIATLQDEVVDMVYSIAPEAVLHGGTAIWRCYQGNRFSKDLDFYAKPSKDFKEKFSEELKKRAIRLDKFKQTRNTVFSKVSSDTVEVSLEIALRRVAKKQVADYERADGSTINIYSLSIEDLIAEKINAYLNRKLVRDLYDVFFLSSKVRDFSKIGRECNRFIKEAKMPVDERNLKALVYSGIAPEAKHMLDTLFRRFKT